jgi:hypothetical protein
MIDVEIKKRGDEAFKKFKFEEAVSFYKEALSSASADPIVLNSNLSACFFEMGDYETCIRHSGIVKDLLDASGESESRKNILEKNITRVQKAKCFVSSHNGGEEVKRSNLTKLNWQEKLNKVKINKLNASVTFVFKINL